MHLPDAATGGLGRFWYLAAIAVLLGPGRSSYKRDHGGEFRGGPRRYGVYGAQADRHGSLPTRDRLGGDDG